MTSMYDVLIILVGEPNTPFQIDMLYLISIIISIILIMYFLYIFKLITGIIRPKG